MSIRKEIFVTQKRLDVTINITYGTDLIPFEFVVVDFALPENATAVAYAVGKNGETKKLICEIEGNTITFTPKAGFFEAGANALQLRVTSDNKNLFSYKCSVQCQGSIASDDAKEVEENPSVLTQVLSKLGDVENMITYDESTKTLNICSGGGITSEELINLSDYVIEKVTLDGQKVELGSINELKEEIDNQQTTLDEYESLTLGVHTDGLIYLFKNGSPKGNGLEIKAEEVAGDVFGYVDENNNIVLSGALADGTYTLKYEMEDGTIVDIGELSLVEDEETGGNLADTTSADWLNDSRLATGYGYAKTLEGSILTNYIPVKVGDILRVKGLNLYGVVGTTNSCIGCYLSTDTTADATGRLNAYTTVCITSMTSGTSGDGIKEDISVDNDVFTYTIAKRGGEQISSASNTTYIRISAPLMDGYTAEDVIITTNEEIA